MNLEAIMLREISQAVKDKYNMMSLIGGIKKKLETSEYNEKQAGSQL